MRRQVEAFTWRPACFPRPKRPTVRREDREDCDDSWSPTQRPLLKAERREVAPSDDDDVPEAPHKTLLALA